MFKCPHCGKPGISVWSKLTIGFHNPTICRVCGNKVGVPDTSLFFIIPFTLVFNSIIFYVDPIALKIAIPTVMALLTFFIYLKYVPLIPK